MNAGPLWLSVQLAAITMLVLLLISTPLAWWLARTASRAKPVVQSLVLCASVTDRSSDRLDTLHVGRLPIVVSGTFHEVDDPVSH